MYVIERCEPGTEWRTLARYTDAAAAAFSFGAVTKRFSWLGDVEMSLRDGNPVEASTVADGRLCRVRPETMLP